MIDFEDHRDHLRAVAFRMLGSGSDADDAVQETWLHMNRGDVSDVDNARGWLTTVIARICLDVLRSRRSHREESLDTIGHDVAGDGVDPEQEALLADAVGVALLVVLQTLSPPERLARSGRAGGSPRLLPLELRTNLLRHRLHLRRLLLLLLLRGNAGLHTDTAGGPPNTRMAAGDRDCALHLRAQLEGDGGNAAAAARRV